MAGQAPRRPRRRARRPGVVLNHDPGVHLRNLKTTPPIEDEVDDLRRVRLLRAGLPEPRPDHDAAPADRPAPRDGAPAARLAGARGAAGASTSTTRSRPAPPTAPARSPARSGSTPASSSRRCARASTAPRAEQVALRLAERWAAVERAARGGPRARATRGPGRARSDARRQPCRAQGGQRRAGARLAAEHAAAGARGAAGDQHARAPPPSTCRPASTGSSAAPGTAPATPARACPRRWSRSPRGPACRSGSPPTSPGTAARRRGRRRATRRARGGWPTTPSRRSGAGATAARCRSSATPAPARSGSRRRRSRCSARSTPSATRKLRILDSIAWAHESLLPTTRDQAQARLGRRPPAVREPPPRARRRARGDRRRARRRGRRPGRAPPAAASPATAACCTPSCPRAATAEQAAELDGRRFDAHLCSNRTCEIGLQQGTGRTYESFVFALEELTRGSKRPAKPERPTAPGTTSGSRRRWSG